MRGKVVYFAFFSLLGVFGALWEFFIPALGAFLLSVYLKKNKSFTPLQLTICMCIFICFFLNGEISQSNNKSKLSGDENNFIISFNNEIKIDGSSFSAYIKDLSSGEKLLFRYNLSSAKEKEQFKSNIKSGLICKVDGDLVKASSYNNPNSFDYKQYLFQNQIFWILESEHMNLKQCQMGKLSLPSYLTNVRMKGVAFIEKNYPQESAALTAALIFGERRLFVEDTEGYYQKIGIVHLLSISGLHIGLLTGMLFYSFIRLGITREKAMKLLILLLPVYALLTGAAPPVTRAVMMMLFLLCSRLLNGPKSIPLDGLCYAFMCYLFISPFVIFDIGFQLSFLVTFALILSAPMITSQFNQPIISLFMISIIAQISSLPIILYHFFEIPIISIVANVLYVPFFSFVILPLAFFVFLLSLYLPTLASPLLWMFSHLVRIGDEGAKVLASLPYSSVIVGRPLPVFLILLILAVFIFFISLEQIKKKPKLKYAVFAPAIVIALQWTITQYSPYGKITFLDVGQGDSIFIKMPFNQGNYLIDTGGVLTLDKEPWELKRNPFDTGRKIVVPFLKSEGVSTLEKLIITHSDIDHIGGAISILKEKKVKQVIMPKEATLTYKAKELILFANHKQIPIHFAFAGDSWKSGESRFYVMAPNQEKLMEGNDASIVIKASLGGLDWLFTGDLEQAGEEELVRKYPKVDIDVLKVGHHGSNTSSTKMFLEHLNPSIAIISVGRNNRFGHPNAEVLERFTSERIAVFRTDQNGAITFIFKGKRGTFLTVLP